MKKKSRCETCRFPDIAVCPVLEVLYDHGHDDPKTCKIADMIEKTWATRSSSLPSSARSDP